MKVLTFSRTFPAHHPKAGQPTWFVEKVWKSLWDSSTGLTNPLVGFVEQYDAVFPCEYKRGENIHQHAPKHHTIRARQDVKVGDKFSCRVWSNAPYRSKQVEFAQVEVKKTWDFVIDLRCHNSVTHINGILATLEELKAVAANDGLSYKDFMDWFAKPFPINEAGIFRGQIICWNENINY